MMHRRKEFKMTGMRAALAVFVYLYAASSAEAFTFSIDALHALPPEELPALASQSGLVRLWMQPDAKTRPRESLALLCSLAHGEVYAEDAEPSPDASECTVRQRSLLGNAWMGESDHLWPYTWYRLALTKDELDALSVALAARSSLPETVTSGLEEAQKGIGALTARVDALEATAAAHADADARLAADIADLNTKVADLASSQETPRDEIDTENKPPGEDATASDLMTPIWWALFLGSAFLALVLILWLRWRRRKEVAPSPAARPSTTEKGTSEVKVALSPKTPPYTEAEVTRGTQRDTIRVEKVGESDVKGSHERVYKTPYAPRVRESNLLEHVRVQWQKNHP